MKQPKIKQTQKEVSVIGTSFSFINLSWYKLERALYLKQYALSKWFTDLEVNYLVAQLHQENWTWSETVRGDGWCSVWLIQWNECVRWKIPYKDWKWQIRLFVDEIKRKYEISWNFRQAQVAWNKPAVLKTWSYKTRYYYKTEKIYRILFS